MGEIEPFRAAIEETFSTVFLPNHVERDQRDYGGIPCDVLVPELYSTTKLIIYIHGGSFAGGSRNSYRNFCSSLAHDTSCRVIVPEFRLPPTYPYPASIEDVYAVFVNVYMEQLADNEESKAEIILAADGSGASIAIAVLFKLGATYKKSVCNLLLFSPWLDMSSSAAIIKDKKAKDDVLSGKNLHRAVDVYTYAANFANPLVSPLQAVKEKFEAFPPVYIQMGAAELLVSQAEQLKDVVQSVGGTVELDLWPKMMFMFQMADEYLPESHLAIEKIGKFLNRHKEIESEEEVEERKEILRKNDIVVD